MRSEFSAVEQQPSANSDQTHLVIIADGWTRRIFRKLLSEGRLPEIDEQFVHAHDGGMIDVVCNLPSVSLTNHTSILTARPPSAHGIIGHQWLDRASGERRDYVGLRRSRKLNSDICERTPTVFEINPLSFAVQSVVRRGTNKLVRLPTMRSGPLLHKSSELAVENPGATIVTWLPRVDVLSHTFGPDSPRVARDMQETSHHLGNLVSRLGFAGVLNTTKILLVPDHGHRPVGSSVPVTTLLRRNGISASVNGQLGPNQSLALTSGDSSAQLYLENRDADSAYEVASVLARDADVELVCTFRDNAVHVFARQGAATITYSADEAKYILMHGVDPLCLLENGVRSATFNLAVPQDIGRYPDFLHQIRASHMVGRSGDVLIMAAEGKYFGVAPRIAWRFGFHKGSHGGPLRDEMLVTAIHRGLRDQLSSDQLIRSTDLLSKTGLMTRGASRNVDNDVIRAGLAATSRPSGL